MSVYFYQTIRRCVPKDDTIHSDSCEHFKYKIKFLTLCSLVSLLSVISVQNMFLSARNEYQEQRLMQARNDHVQRARALRVWVPVHTHGPLRREHRTQHVNSGV
jgi:hypothetical protein